MNRQPPHDKLVHCIADLEEQARLKLAPMVRDFYGGGSMDLQTLRENQTSYERYRLRPQVMRDTTSVDPSTVCLGARNSMPLGFSPAANACLAHPDGEVGNSRAASAQGINMVLSTWSNKSLEEVASQGRNSTKTTAYAQQMSLVRDRSINTQIIKRAEAAGYKALFISVDCSWLGRRLNEFRNNFTLPEEVGFPNVPDIDPHNMVDNDERIVYETNLVWEHVQWFKSQTKLQVWLKGILTAEDAARAVEAGADGIVVSNHGGRQLDGTLATIDALPEVVEAVRGRIPVHIDGGIRRGSDIFKALALGADYCWIGRIPLWGLAYNGSDGVAMAVKILYDELRTVMALMGCRTVDEIGASHLAVLQGDGRYRKLKDLPWKQGTASTKDLTPPTESEKGHGQSSSKSVGILAKPASRL
ncbi:unnamed protein product [Sympodiomycopsis kandeliae]